MAHRIHIYLFKRIFLVETYDTCGLLDQDCGLVGRLYPRFPNSRSKWSFTSWLGPTEELGIQNPESPSRLPSHVHSPFLRHAPQSAPGLPDCWLGAWPRPRSILPSSLTPFTLPFPLHSLTRLKSDHRCQGPGTKLTPGEYHFFLMSVSSPFALSAPASELGCGLASPADLVLPISESMLTEGPHYLSSLTYVDIYYLCHLILSISLLKQFPNFPLGNTARWILI